MTTFLLVAIQFYKQKMTITSFADKRVRDLSLLWRRKGNFLSKEIPGFIRFKSEKYINKSEMVATAKPF